MTRRDGFHGGENIAADPVEARFDPVGIPVPRAAAGDIFGDWNNQFDAFASGDAVRSVDQVNIGRIIDVRLRSSSSLQKSGD